MPQHESREGVEASAAKGIGDRLVGSSNHFACIEIARHGAGHLFQDRLRHAVVVAD